MDQSDYQVISHYNTLKSSIMLCIHDEVLPLGTFQSCQFVLSGQHSVPPLFGNKIAYTKRMTSRHLVFFCRIKPLKNNHFALTFFQETQPVSELKVASGNLTGKGGKVEQTIQTNAAQEGSSFSSFSWNKHTRNDFTTMLNLLYATWSGIDQSYIFHL